jgi:hypothetical protein
VRAFGPLAAAADAADADAVVVVALRLAYP